MVLVPGSEGEMGILPHHAPVLTTLAYGELVVRKGRAEESFVIFGGVVDIRPDRVIVLADLAEFVLRHRRGSGGSRPRACRKAHGAGRAAGAESSGDAGTAPR